MPLYYVTLRFTSGKNLTVKVHARNRESAEREALRSLSERAVVTAVNEDVREANSGV